MSYMKCYVTPCLNKKNTRFSMLCATLFCNSAAIEHFCDDGAQTEMKYTIL